MVVEGSAGFGEGVLRSLGGGKVWGNGWAILGVREVRRLRLRSESAFDRRRLRCLEIVHQVSVELERDSLAGDMNNERIETLS